MSGFANKGPQDVGPASAYPFGPHLFDAAVAIGGGGYTAATGIVARAGGLRPAATPLRAAINHITVCATAADSVALPAAVGGQVIMVINTGAQSAQVYAAVGTNDVINGFSAGAGVPMAAASKEAFISPAPGLWFGILSA
jgi:hypothetical protein